ncbi:MAG: hypothetical protein IKE75_04910 [Bacilli bacterium]|nr:hypothetical protein [Bacilli bacterium]
MKGNKKILTLSVLVLLLAVCFTTYAIYKSSATGTGSVDAAAWVVSVNDTDIVANNTFTLGNITWATPRVGQNNTIAPGDHGTVDITIDADGSEVAVDYAITIDTTALNNSNFTVTAASGSNLTGTIPYSATAGAMERTITLDITWTGVDSAEANAADIDLAGDELSIPVTVTATQNPNPAS